MSTLPAAALLCEVPDSAVPEYGITIIAYVDESGEQAYGWATHGDASFSSMLGLMGMVQHRILHWEDDE